jgi:threonine dehydrogenase-like Zn-dependent dehydrogenase
MDKMKRLVFPSPARVILETSPTPSIRESAVLVESEYSLVSNGTERTVFQRRFARDTHWDRWVCYPFLPGYATVGTVVDTGSASSKVKIGQRVALRTPHASHHLVAESSCIPIPNDVALEEAVWFAISRIAFLGTWIAKVKPGTPVLVVGGGPLAQVVVRWLISDRCASVGLLARDPVQLKKATEGGTTITIPGQTQEYPSSDIEKVLGERPGIIFDCTSSSEVLSWALRVVADYGKVVLIGDPGSPDERRLTADVLLRSVTVTGVHDRNTFGQWTDHTVSRVFFERLSGKRIHVRELCTHTFAPEQASEAYALLCRREEGVIGVRFEWRGKPKQSQVSNEG